VQLLLNNEKLPAKAAAISMIVIMSCIYSHNFRASKLSLEKCLVSPDFCENKLLEVGRAKIARIRDNELEIIQGKKRIWVLGTDSFLQEISYINLTAIFHKEGHLQAQEIRVLRLRRLRIVVSVFPLLVIAFLFFKNYKFSFPKFEAEEQ